MDTNQFYVLMEAGGKMMPMRFIVRANETGDKKVKQFLKYHREIGDRIIKVELIEIK